MNATILYSDMRTTIELKDSFGRPVPFSCTCITADRLKRAGGDTLHFVKAVKYCDLKYLGKTRNGFKGRAAKAKERKEHRDPNHWKNATTNFAHLAKDETRNAWVHNGHVNKIHYRLIIEFNGKEVIWD